MKNKFFASLLLLALCLSVMAPAAYAAETGSSETTEPVVGATTPTAETAAPSESAPALPKVYNGAAIGSSSRKQYTEATRPADASPLNSVVDNPDYGNEFNFLTITNATTGDAWRAGTMELVAGDQYLVEVYCRHDGTDSYRCNEYSNVMLNIDMPYELGAGEVQDFGGRIIAGNNVNIYASIGVVAREGVSIQYVDGTAKSTGTNGEATIAYEELFGAGATMLRYSRRLTAGDYRLVSFVIQVVADASVPAVDSTFDYSALSASGTGFGALATTEVGDGNVAGEDVADGAVTDADEAKATDEGRDGFVLVVVAALAIGGCVGVAVATKKQKGA